MYKSIGKSPLRSRDVVVACLFGVATFLLSACSDMSITIPGAAPPLLREEFVLGQTASWELESDETGSTTIVPEQLLIEIMAPNLVQYATLEELAVEDFHLEVDGRILSGSPQSSYGVLFRMQGPQQFYRFEITGDGLYSLERHDGDGTRMLFFGDWRESQAINQGLNVNNRVGVRAQGSDISLFVNGNMLDEVSDETYATGFIGLDAGTFDVAPLQVAFDNLIIYPPAPDR